MDFIKLDEADIGPSDWSPDIVAWTPKQNYDSIKKAGYRLFWAASLRMDYVENEELYSHEFEGDGYWNKEWSCSQQCFQVLASVRDTRYRSDTEFKKILSKTPSFLKPHLMARRKSK